MPSFAPPPNMSESAQQVARRVLADVSTLVALGKLQQHHLDAVRLELDAVANPPPPIVARKPPSLSAAPPRRRYRAIWSYAGTEADELTFTEADTIELVEEVGEGWWKGAVVRADGTRGSEGLFPSNYVEALPDSLPALPPRFNASSAANNTNTDDEKRAMGLHASPNPPTHQMPMPYGAPHEQQQQHLGPPRWQPGVARWSSGAPPMPPPPPPMAQNGSYYDNPPPSQQPYAGPTQNTFNGTAPHVPTEAEAKKTDKFKKMGGRLGQSMATGFAGGVGFGVGSHLF